MYSELANRQELVASYFMGLAIDKAHRCSPYMGVGCVITSAGNKLLRIGAQKLGGTRHILNELYERVHDENTLVYLTQEPYLLSELAERELIALLTASGIRKIIMANPAPGRFAGRWGRTMKSYGIDVEFGVRSASAGLSTHVGEKLVVAGKPWVTCLLFLDADEKDLAWTAFERNFGFEADLARLISSHAFLVTSDAANDLQAYMERNFSKHILGQLSPPQLVTLDIGAGASGALPKLQALQQTQPFAVMLLPVSTRLFVGLDGRELVDEVVVYQLEKELAPGDPERVRLVPDADKWKLHDYSPLGDCLRYIYRSVPFSRSGELH